LASKSKKKTTFSKLNREAAVRERRQLKEARRAARKETTASPPPVLSDVPARPVDDEIDDAAA
jgi:hypothetical protein